MTAYAVKKPQFNYIGVSFGLIGQKSGLQPITAIFDESAKIFSRNGPSILMNVTFREMGPLRLYGGTVAEWSKALERENK